MNTPEALTAYFEDMIANCANNPQFEGLSIRSFIEGDSRRLIENSRSELNYPLFFLEIPAFQLGQNFKADPNGSARFGFAVLENSPVGDYALQRQIRQRTYLTGLRVLGQLVKDSKTKGFYLHLDSTLIEPVNSWFVDNDFGYRFEILLSKIGFVNLNICA